MSLIAVTASETSEVEPYVTSLRKRNGEALILVPETFQTGPEALRGASGLLLSGGHDVHPRYYGQDIDPDAGVSPRPERDAMEFALLSTALEWQMPVLGICRGMQLINVAFGGSLVQHIEDHRPSGSQTNPFKHAVYVSPGSKLGTILGIGAVFNTNSYHHQGVREADKAPSLLASAYHVQDGIIEALESPQHKLLIAVQCHIEKEREVPPLFLRLFDWLLEWATDFERKAMP